MSNYEEPNNVTIELINQQLTCMQEIIDQLLHNLRINEMDTTQKLNTAVRFICQYQRALALRQLCEKATPDTPSEAEILGLMRIMREKPKNEITMIIEE